VDITSQHHPDHPVRTTTAAILASPAPPVRWVVPGYVGEVLTVLDGH
jgi:hypothetical protein